MSVNKYSSLSNYAVLEPRGTLFIFGEDEYGLGSVLLEKENYKPLSSFVTKATNLAFPTKGTIESRPKSDDWAHGTTNGKSWQIHDVILGDVTFKQFKPQ